MAPRPWVNESVNRLLGHLQIQTERVSVLVQDATVKAWDEWETAPNGSYRAGRELTLLVSNAAHAEIERLFSEVHAALKAAARAAGLAYLRLDTDASANIVLVDVDGGENY